MKKQNGIRAVLWTVLMLAAVLTGCCADGEDACTLDPANPARFTCGGVEYITLREAVPRDAVGRKLGDIQTLAAVDGEGRVVDTCGVTLSFSALARLEERLPEGWRKKRRSQQPEWLRSAFFVFSRAYFRTGAGPVLSRTISCGRSSTLLTATPFIRLSSRLNALLPSASLSCRMVVRGGSQPAASGRSS